MCRHTREENMTLLLVDTPQAKLPDPEGGLLAWVTLNFGKRVATIVEGVLRGTIPDTRDLLSTEDHRIRQEASKRGVTLPRLHIYRG
ncbi:MAG: hypothetical protein KGH79_01085 [Patescibacteria group bacterium]|nr:hypothetical protein [Patescibacteria group bacterium]